MTMPPLESTVFFVVLNGLDVLTIAHGWHSCFGHSRIFIRCSNKRPRFRSAGKAAEASIWPSR
jgi:hypothetical protein